MAVAVLGTYLANTKVHLVGSIANEVRLLFLICLYLYNVTFNIYLFKMSFSSVFLYRLWN